MNRPRAGVRPRERSVPRRGALGRPDQPTAGVAGPPRRRRTRSRSADPGVTRRLGCAKAPPRLAEGGRRAGEDAAVCRLRNGEKPARRRPCARPAATYPAPGPRAPSAPAVLRPLLLLPRGRHRLCRTARLGRARRPARVFTPPSPGLGCFRGPRAGQERFAVTRAGRRAQDPQHGLGGVKGSERSTVAFTALCFPEGPPGRWSGRRAAAEQTPQAFCAGPLRPPPASPRPTEGRRTRTRGGGGSGGRRLRGWFPELRRAATAFSSPAAATSGHGRAFRAAAGTDPPFCVHSAAPALPSCSEIPSRKPWPPVQLSPGLRRAFTLGRCATLPFQICLRANSDRGGRWDSTLTGCRVTAAPRLYFLNASSVGSPAAGVPAPARPRVSKPGERGVRAPGTRTGRRGRGADPEEEEEDRARRAEG